MEPIRTSTLEGISEAIANRTLKVPKGHTEIVASVWMWESASRDERIIFVNMCRIHRLTYRLVHELPPDGPYVAPPRPRLELIPVDPSKKELPPGSAGVIVFSCEHGHMAYGALPPGIPLEDATPDHYEFVLPPHAH